MISLYLITHLNIGQEMLNVCLEAFKPLPLPSQSLGIFPDTDVERARYLASTEIGKLDQGDGVLLLTDLFGATPSNLAHAIESEHVIDIISGVNLAMLFRIYNYADTPTDELIHKAISGARQSINCKSMELT